MMKNDFYFKLEPVLVLEIFTFLSERFSCARKRFDKKAMVNFKIMTSQTLQQIITIQILFNISRNKGNQKTKFAQLIEYNMVSIFLKKSYIQCGGEARPRPFHKTSKLSISLD